jgi:membrane protein YqaA with SNARE-associated domain
MTVETIVIAAIVGAIAGVIGGNIGYDLGRARRKSINVKDIDKYLHEQFPSEWTAYHRGVNEGYAQGRRDGEAGHESP